MVGILKMTVHHQNDEGQEIKDWQGKLFILNLGENRNNTFGLLQRKAQIHLHCKYGKQCSLIMNCDHERTGVHIGIR